MTKEKTRPVLDERFIKSIKGKEFVLYAGLLDLSHQIGIQSISIEILQYPSQDNGHEAICKARVESKTGEEFVEIADANPNNVAPLVKQHVLRMAATRAKARALRDMTNIGITSLEELGNIDELENDPPDQNHHTPNHRASQKAERHPGTGDGKPAGGEKKTDAGAKEKPKKEPLKSDPPEPPLPTGKPKMSEAQKKAILSLAQRKGLSEDDLAKKSIETFNVYFEYLDSSSASEFIRELQQAA